MTCTGPDSAPWAMVDGIQHRKPYVPARFMAIDTNVYRCAGDGAACPGAFLNSHSSTMCAYSGSGVACAECPLGWGFNGNQCIACAQIGTGPVIAFIIIVILGMCLVAQGTRPLEGDGKFSSFTINSMRHSSVLNMNLSLLINLLQTTWIFSKMSIKLPITTRQAMSSTGSVFDLSAFNLECIGSNSDPRSYALTRVVLQNIGPGLVVVWYVIVLTFGRCCVCLSQKPEFVFAFNSMVGLFAAFFMAIANAAINDGFAVYGHPSGERSLKAFPFILDWQAEAVQIRIVSLIGMIVWCVGGAAIIGWLLWMMPRKIKDKQFRKATLSIVIKYANDKPWWYLVALLTSLLITMSVSFFETGQWQLVYALLILVVYFGALLSFKPYFSWLVHYADVASTGGKIFLLVCSLPYQSLPDDEKNEAGAEAAIIPVIAILAYTCGFLMLLHVALIFANFRTRGKSVELDMMMEDLGGRVAEKLPGTSDLEEICDDREEAMAKRQSRSSVRASKRGRSKDDGSNSGSPASAGIAGVANAEFVSEEGNGIATF